MNSNIGDDNFIKIASGRPTSLTCDEFLTRYSRIFSESRNKKLSLPQFTPIIPTNLLSQTFIKQLLTIEDITINEEELIIEFSTSRVRIARCLEQWVQKGEVVSDEVIALHTEVKSYWRNEHHGAFRKCLDEDINDKALEILKTLRALKFKLGDDELHLDYSNGELYLLSDEKIIGWHKDWEKI